MKNLLFYSLTVILFTTTLFGCLALGNIFEAGVYTGIFLWS